MLFFAGGSRGRKVFKSEASLEGETALNRAGALYAFVKQRKLYWYKHFQRVKVQKGTIILEFLKHKDISCWIRFFLMIWSNFCRGSGPVFLEVQIRFLIVIFFVSGSRASTLDPNPREIVDPKIRHIFLSYQCAPFSRNFGQISGRKKILNLNGRAMQELKKPDFAAPHSDSDFLTPGTTNKKKRRLYSATPQHSEV